MASHAWAIHHPCAYLVASDKQPCPHASDFARRGKLHSRITPTTTTTRCSLRTRARSPRHRQTKNSANVKVKKRKITNAPFNSTHVFPFASAQLQNYIQDRITKSARRKSQKLRWEPTPRYAHGAVVVARPTRAPGWSYVQPQSD